MPISTRPTGRLRAERQLDQADRALEEFKYALDQAAIVAITDQRGIITYVNDKFCDISKYSRDELIGRDHRIVNSGHHPASFIRDLWRSIAQGQVWRGELRNRAKDGTIYWVDTTIVPLLDERGKPTQYLAIRSDITQRKLAEAQLREQASLAKLGELAAIVAHEVRNPLAGIKGSLQILGSRMPAGVQDRQIVDVMIERLDALSARVSDILLYAGTTPPNLQAVAVRALVTEVVSSARAAVRGPTVEIGTTGVDAVVRADPHMLREVFLNLVLNACQASSAGSTVEIAMEAIRGTAHVSILDRGQGIPEETRTRIFEPFFTTRRGGTGLGLSIVKRLLERQGGTIALEDRIGGGTTAIVTLPLYGG